MLQERSVQRLGRRYAKKIDLHLICATNDDLDNLVPRGRFREDLYYRIDVMPILVPPPRASTRAICRCWSMAESS